MDLDDIEDMLEAPYKVVEKTIADILPVADTEMKVRLLVFTQLLTII